MATVNSIKLICLLLQVTDIVYGNPQRFSNSTLQMGLRACNFEKFCSVNIDPPLENNGTNTTCCAPCSCLPSCWLIGDCCPDIQELYESPFGNIELKCEGNYINVRQVDLFSSTVYKKITQCPFDYTDQKTKQLCEEPFGAEFSIHHFSFADILTVSSPDQFIFRNRHCAACHGIHDVHRWDMVFASCIEQFNGYIELKDVIENCGIFTIPTEGLGAERSECTDNGAVSTCSEEGNPDYVDDDVEKACRFSSFPVTVEHMTGYRTYLNIFCRLCNTPPTTLPLRCPGAGVKNTIVSYTSFFNIDMTKTTPKKTPRVYRCSSDQIYDDIMNVCRDLICPFSRKPDYESCVDSGYRWFEAAITFPLSISTFDVRLAAIQNSRQRIAKVGNSFLNTTGLLTTCSTCLDNVFYNDSDERTLIVDMSIHLDSRCTYDYIEASMTSIKSKPAHLEVPLNETRSINATIKMFPIFDMSAVKTLYRLRTCVNGQMFKMNRLFDCPYIVLNETEYCTWVNRDMHHLNQTCILSVNTINTKQTMELVYTNGEAKIRICLNSYLQRFFSSTGSRFFKPYLSTFVLCAVILVVVQYQ